MSRLYILRNGSSKAPSTITVVQTHPVMASTLQTVDTSGDQKGSLPPHVWVSRLMCFGDKAPEIESVDASPKPEAPIRERVPSYRSGLFGILVTLLLLGGTVGLLKGFEAKGALTRSQKYFFNTLIIVLTLYLALNITVSDPGKQEIRGR